MIFELVKDFSDALAAMPASHPRRRILQLLEEALRRDIHFIAQHPTALFQCLWNSFWWYAWPEEEKESGEGENGGQMGRGVLSGQQLQPTVHQLLSLWRAAKEENQIHPCWVRLRNRPQPRPSPARAMTLIGHRGPVLSLARSPDGSFLASGGKDGMIRLWDTATGQLRLTLKENNGPVDALCFLRGGERLVSGARYGRIVIWEPNTGQLVQRAWGTAKTLAPSPGENEFVAGLESGTLNVVNVDTGETLHRVSWGNAPIRFLSLLRGRRLVACSQDGRIGISDWSAENLADFVQIAETSQINRACLLSGGTGLATGHPDGTVRLWDIPSGRPGKEFRDLNAQICSIAASPDGKHLIFGGGLDGPIVVVRDLMSETVVGRFQEHSNPVGALTFLDQGDWVASGSADDTIKVWQISRLEKSPASKEEVTIPTGLFFICSGEAVVCSRRGRGPFNPVQGPSISVFDSREFATVQAISREECEDVFASARDPDSPRMYTLDTKGELRLWRLREGVGNVLLPASSGHDAQGGPILRGWQTLAQLNMTLTWDELAGQSLGRDARIAVIPHKNAVAVGDHRGRVTLYCLGRSEPLAAVDLHEGFVNALAVSAHGEFLASAGSDGVLAIVGAKDLSEIVRIQLERSPIECLAFSPDVRQLLVGSKTGTVWVCELSQLVSPKAIYHHQGPVLDIAWFNGDRGVASVGGDKTVRFWNVASGACMAAFVVAHPLIRCAASPLEENFVVAVDTRGNLYGLEISHPASSLPGEKREFDDVKPQPALPSHGKPTVVAPADDLDDLLRLSRGPSGRRTSRSTWTAPPQRREDDGRL